MEKRNLRRPDPYTKSTKTADQGDNIKETEKNTVSKQKTTNTLLQADRGDTKLKHARDSDQRINNERKNDVKSKSPKDLIFQSRRGRLELKPSKPRNQQIPVKDGSEKPKTSSPGDNYIVMDSEIKPFLTNKKPDYVTTDTSSNNAKIAGMDKTKELDADERRRMREKYTNRNVHLKSYSFDNTSNLLQNDSSRRICNDNQQSNKMTESKSESTKTVKEPDVNKSVNSKRKPVITTVRSKRDNTKVYKTVTFTDFKAEQRQPIQIKIPTDEVIKKREHEVPVVEQLMCDKATDASQHSSGKEKSISRRKRAAKLRRGPVPSPEPLLKGDSPPTEVARWAPNSVNKQNKPYYEAWVDTTLAAITKYSKKDKMLLEKRNLLESFRRMLERPESPDLVFNHADEQFMGKIRIRQK